MDASMYDWVDANGDGYVEGGGADTNGDGYYDTLAIDLNADGYVESYAYDTNGDTVFDTAQQDTDLDGYLDTTIPLSGLTIEMGNTGYTSAAQSFNVLHDQFLTDGGSVGFGEPVAEPYRYDSTTQSSDGDPYVDALDPEPTNYNEPYEYP